MFLFQRGLADPAALERQSTVQKIGLKMPLVCEGAGLRDRLATDCALAKRDSCDGARTDAGLAFGQRHLAARADLRLGAVALRRRAPPDLVAGRAQAMEGDHLRVGRRPLHRVAAAQAGADQDRFAPQCCNCKKCCNTFSFDRCNKSVLPERHDGESVSEDTSPRFLFYLLSIRRKTRAGLLIERRNAISAYWFRSAYWLGKLSLAGPPRKQTL